MGNTCVEGTTDEACGSGGLPCIKCSDSELCAKSQCIPLGTNCNPSTCPSGCCKKDTCVDGTSKDACGSGGIPCETCAGSQDCDNQSCSCDSDTCAGCCDESGACRSGTETDACGSGGQRCATCSLDQICLQGSCSGVACSAATCDGCCDGTTCKSGMDADACGQGGQACNACLPEETCMLGTCVDSSLCGPGSCSGCCEGGTCKGGADPLACGSGGGPCQICTKSQMCQAGACQLDPSSSWGVIFVGATIDQAKTWDNTPFFTKPDPYVEVSVGPQTDKTTNKDDSYEPQWDELVFTTTADALLTWGMDLKVFDDDWPTSDELIGSCTVTVTESMLVSGGGSTSCGADVTSLEYKLQAQ